MVLMLRLALSLQMGSTFVFWLIALTGSLTFLVIVFSLVLLVGDPGKALAVLLLIFQLAAAGGAFPVELSSPIFQVAHPLLPVTDILKAFRAIMFQAYEGAWWRYELRMLAILALCFCGAVLLGRKWKVVEDADYNAAIDL
jgi:putative membrane protein